MANSTLRVPSVLWHATPFDNLEGILSSRALLANPTTACRRAPSTPTLRTPRGRHRADGVYLAFQASTPFVHWHLRQGIALAFLLFSPEILWNSDSALVRCNGKAWRHRDDLAPERELCVRQQILAEWGRGRWPSLECVVDRQLNLANHWIGLGFASADAKRVEEILTVYGLHTFPWTPQTLRLRREKPHWADSRLPVGTLVWTNRNYATTLPADATRCIPTAEAPLGAAFTPRIQQNESPPLAMSAGSFSFPPELDTAPPAGYLSTRS